MEKEKDTRKVIERRINRKIADIKAQLKNKGVSRDRVILDRELLNIYELLKQINNKPIPYGDISRTTFILFLAASIYILAFLGFVLLTYTKAVKPFVSWLVSTWNNSSAGVQLTIFVTLLIATGASIWGLYKHFSDKK